MCMILSGIAKWLEVRTRRSPKLKGQVADGGFDLDHGPDAGEGVVAAQLDDPRFRQGETVTEVIAAQADDDHDGRRH